MTFCCFKQCLKLNKTALGKSSSRLQYFPMPKYHTYGFRTFDLLKNLSQFFRNPAQIRYEMNKLRARGIVEKKKSMSFYRVTDEGWKWLWLSICSEQHFKNPMISSFTKKRLPRHAEQPSQIEAAYSLLDQGLSLLTQQLAVIS